MKRNTDLKGRMQLPLPGFVPLVSLLGLLFLSSKQPAIAASTAQPTSAAAAEAWLALVDKGEYAKSWEAGADMFRKEVTKNQWVASLKSVRQPLGDLISRKAISAKEMESLPGMPSGSYWVG